MTIFHIIKKPVLGHNVGSNGADQAGHLCSFISIFGVSCIDNLMYTVTVSSFKTIKATAS